MAVQGSQALCLPRFNLLDGRTGFSSAAQTHPKCATPGCSDLHTVPCDGRDVRDDPLATEQDLRQVLIDMIPIPGQAHAEGGHLMRNLLAEFLRGFSLRTLIFLLDMVLPQLDAYHARRQLQHLQPWISVELAQQQARGQQGVELAVKYVYEAYAGFHVIQLLTEGAPILLFSDPNAVPHVSPWNLCATGNLGSMESNVMAGRALFGRFQLPDGLRRCAIFLVQEKVMHGTSRAADYRAYRRIAPKSLELVIVSRPVAFAFCGRLLVQQPAGVDYKGGPNSVSKNHISFRCQKRTQKLVPCTCLSRS